MKLPSLAVTLLAALTSCEKPKRAVEVPESTHQASSEIGETPTTPEEATAVPVVSPESKDWTGQTVPLLLLQNGDSFSKVTFERIEPDQITIRHATGIASIAMEDLREESRTALGYDPEKANQARAKRHAAEVAKARENEKRAKAAAERAKKQEMIANAIDDTFKVIQVLSDEGGYLVVEFTPGGAVGSVQSAINAISGSGSSFVPSRTGSTVYFLRGKTGQATVDDDIIEVAYAETEETFEYQTSMGSKKTIRVLELVKVYGTEN